MSGSADCWINTRDGVRDGGPTRERGDEGSVEGFRIYYESGDVEDSTQMVERTTMYQRVW